MHPDDRMTIGDRDDLLRVVPDMCARIGTARLLDPEARRRRAATRDSAPESRDRWLPCGTNRYRDALALSRTGTREPAAREDGRRISDSCCRSRGGASQRRRGPEAPAWFETTPTQDANARRGGTRRIVETCKPAPLDGPPNDHGISDRRTEMRSDLSPAAAHFHFASCDACPPPFRFVFGAAPSSLQLRVTKSNPCNDMSRPSLIR